MLRRLGDDKIATMGAASAELDYAAAWRAELGPCCPADTQRKRGAAQEWCTDIPVVGGRFAPWPACRPAGRPAYEMLEPPSDPH